MSELTERPVEVIVGRFEMKHLFFSTPAISFTEIDAPKWLTSENTVRGSTMDTRWFWRDCVLSLRVGESVDTDFRRITRLPPNAISTAQTAG